MGSAPHWTNQSYIIHMKISHYFSFLREYLRHPLSVASVLPSGKFLAQLMTRGVCSHTGHVLELGPGTGVFTQALIERGVPEKNLTLVELGKNFAHILEDRFPSARVLRMNATEIDDCSVFGHVCVDAVICGLGFLAMPQDAINKILSSSFKYLRPDGKFFLFTYGAHCSVPPSILKKLGLQAAKVGKTYLNFPPATVYQITRVT